MDATERSFYVPVMGHDHEGQRVSRRTIFAGISSVGFGRLLAACGARRRQLGDDLDRRDGDPAGDHDGRPHRSVRRRGYLHADADDDAGAVLLRRRQDPQRCPRGSGGYAAAGGDQGAGQRDLQAAAQRGGRGLALRRRRPLFRRRVESASRRRSGGGGRPPAAGGALPALRVAVLGRRSQTTGRTSRRPTTSVTCAAPRSPTPTASSSSPRSGRAGTAGVRSTFTRWCTSANRGYSPRS